MSKITYTTENDGLHALKDGVFMTPQEQFDYDWALHRQWSGTNRWPENDFLRTWEVSHTECKVCHPA